MNDSSRMRLDGFDDPNTARLLGMIVALGGEVFVLKAQVERLTRALQRAGVLDAVALEAMSEDPNLAAWVGREEKSFGTALLQPFLAPDLVKQVTGLMDQASSAARDPKARND
jgi:hypothetical protein